jgi:hypothetical protein
VRTASCPGRRLVAWLHTRISGSSTTNCSDLEGNSSGLTQVTELRKNTTHAVAVPDEIRTTDLASASKQHTNPLGDTIQTGVVAHTDCPSGPYPTIASVATVVLIVRSSAKCHFCLTSIVNFRTPSTPCWCTKFTAVCICILGSPSCHGHFVCGCRSAS